MSQLTAVYVPPQAGYTNENSQREKAIPHTEQPDFDEDFVRFSRALTNLHSGKGAEAWRQICQQYESLVCHWAVRHSLMKRTGEEPIYFATTAFANMWIYFAEGKGDFSRFPDLRSLLKFLMVCVNNIIVEHYRNYVVRTELDAPHAENPVDLVAVPQARFSRIEREELWHAIYQEANTDLERCFIYGYFELLLPRREIARIFPQFDDIDAVKQVMDRLLKRLRRNASLKHFLEAYR